MGPVVDLPQPLVHLHRRTCWSIHFLRCLTMPLDDEQDVYQDHILDHYEDPYHRGHCDHATHAHEDDNPLCGDVIHVELQMDGRAVSCRPGSMATVVVSARPRRRC